MEERDREKPVGRVKRKRNPLGRVRSKTDPLGRVKRTKHREREARRVKGQ